MYLLYTLTPCPSPGTDRRLVGRGAGGEGGRAAVVVPNGTLYASGVTARIREELLREFKLHTVVRLPKGVFEPYADIPTNILFFERGSPVSAVWFYEHPLPPHRAKLRSPSYSQSDPLQYEEFGPLLKWWNHHRENEHAWRVPISALEEADWNLDQRNPSSNVDLKIDILGLVQRIRKQADKLSKHLEEAQGSAKALHVITEAPNGDGFMTGILDKWCTITKGNSPTLKTQPGPYKFVVTAADRRTADSYQFDSEAVCVPMVSSTGHGHAAVHRIHYESGKFALANIMAAIGVKPDIPLLTKYLYYYLWRFKDEKLVSLMAGTANTSLTIEKLKTVNITFPNLHRQEEVVAALDRIMNNAVDLEVGSDDIHDMCERLVQESLIASIE